MEKKLFDKDVLIILKINLDLVLVDSSKCPLKSGPLIAKFL